MKRLDANLRALQISQHTDLMSVCASTVTYIFCPFDVIFVSAVRKIHSDNIHACLDHLIQNMLGIRGRTKGGDNFCSSWHKLSLILFSKHAA